MAEIFVSYARENLEGARRLVRALERHHNVAFDVDDLLAGEKFWSQLARLIDAADAVVVVLTPDLLRSDPCRREIDHAAAGHKRILPVLHVDVGEEPLPDSVAQTQWVFLRQADDFEAGVAKILAAIEVDPAWVRCHADLLVRAREWEARHRDDARLLRGSQLDEAEQFLAEAVGIKEPRPTELHGEYILASRRSDTRRRRGRMLLAVGVAIVLAVLAGVALLQRQRAEHEALVARAQAMAAQAQLAAVSDPLAEELGTVSPERAALLAIGSLRLWPTIEADAALRNILTRLPPSAPPAWLQRETSDEVDPPPAPEEVFSSDRRYRARSPEGPEEPVVVEADGRRIELAHEWTVQAMRFSDDGRWFVTVTAPVSMDAEDPAATVLVGSTIRVWEVGTWDLRSQISLAPQGGIVETLFSPDGAILVTYPRSGSAQRWTVAPDQLVSEACARLSRNPSPTEQSRFGLAADTCPGLPIVSE